MNVLRSPLTSPSLLMWKTRERKQRVLSPAHSMFFLIYTRIVLYHHRKFRHHLVTKATKIIVLLYASMCKKVSIYNGFHTSRLFDNKNKYHFFIKVFQLYSLYHQKVCKCEIHHILHGEPEQTAE